MKRKMLITGGSLLCGVLIGLNVFGVGSSSRVEAAAVFVWQQEASNAPAEVREKIRALGSANPEERAGAACELGLMRGRAVAAIPSLIKLLGDETVIKRVFCNDGGGRRSMGLGVDEKSSPGEQAAGALASIGEPAVLPLIDVVKADDWRVRRNATCALGVIKDERTVQPVLASLKDQDWRVREKAAWGLGLKKGEQVVEPLIAALGDAASQVREQAAWALGLKGDGRAVADLRVAAKDKDEDVRKNAEWALNLLGMKDTARRGDYKFKFKMKEN